MSRKYKFHNPEGLYFISYTAVYWLDVFIRNEYKNILIESWKYCQQNKGLIIYAWVIMSSHVHMIISSRNEKPDNIIRDIKRHTAGQLRRAIFENPQESRKEWMLWLMKRAGIKNKNNNDFQFWQQDNKPIELTDNKLINQKLDYIHSNPVRAGIVSNPEDYIYSSARDYSGEKGLLAIVLIE